MDQKTTDALKIDLHHEWKATHLGFARAKAQRDGTQINTATPYNYGKHTIVEWIVLCINGEGAESFLAECANFGRLDWSNEALVLRYAELFDDRIVALSARRLAPHHRSLAPASA